MKIILLGPTASGKTELSLLVAEKLNTPIISVDSRQCYKYLDIGTAKPSSDELERIPHFNISVLEPDEPDSASKFLKRASGWEKDISAQSKYIFYAGGSTLHLQSLIRPFDEMPDANPENIEQLNGRIETEGLDSLYEILKTIDPAYIAKMDGMNRQRIMRALDVWMQTGRPFSSFHQNEAFALPHNTLVFGLAYERNVLYDRINNRVDTMIKSGLIEETEAILRHGFSKEAQALKTVGYREVIFYLENVFTKKEMAEKIKTSTRHYAKRQLTWFRRWDFVDWLPTGDKKPQELAEIIVSRIAAEPHNH